MEKCNLADCVYDISLSGELPVLGKHRDLARPHVQGNANVLFTKVEDGSKIRMTIEVEAHDCYPTRNEDGDLSETHVNFSGEVVGFAIQQSEPGPEEGSMISKFVSSRCPLVGDAVQVFSPQWDGPSAGIVRDVQIIRVDSSVKHVEIVEARIAVVVFPNTSYFTKTLGGYPTIIFPYLPFVDGWRVTVAERAQLVEQQATWAEWPLSASDRQKDPPQTGNTEDWGV